MQIQHFIGRRVIVSSKDEEFEVLATLKFFNYNKNVIHLNNYMLLREQRLVETGEFFVFDDGEWKNIRIPDNAQMRKMEENIKMGKNYKPYKTYRDAQGRSYIRTIKDDQEQGAHPHNVSGPTDNKEKPEYAGNEDAQSERKKKTGTDKPE